MIPGFHHRFKDWLETYKTLDAANDAVNLLGTAVPVPGKKGDLILCKITLPHADSKNTSDRPRFVQYINFVRLG